ncbi:hypothetical protein AUI06_10605 [archaeon 13_2_20CM_2_52_21]|nr:MAG: hypothetical protein AUI06_10605 [archaeon 13_2_20CM_2_52_21]
MEYGPANPDTYVRSHVRPNTLSASAGRTNGNPANSTRMSRAAVATLGPRTAIVFSAYDQAVPFK